MKRKSRFNFADAVNAAIQQMRPRPGVYDAWEIDKAISPSLLTAYLNTHCGFVAHGLCHALRVGEASASVAALMKRHGAKSAAFLTAYNPRSQMRSTVYNKLAHQRLWRLLRNGAEHSYSASATHGLHATQQTDQQTNGSFLAIPMLVRSGAEKR